MITAAEARFLQTSSVDKKILEIYKKVWLDEILQLVLENAYKGKGSVQFWKVRSVDFKFHITYLLKVELEDLGYKVKLSENSLLISWS